MEGDKALTGALSLTDGSKEFRIKALEAIGWLVYSIHRNRGRLNWLTYSRAITRFPTAQAATNWKNLDAFVKEREVIVWEIAPPRAILWDLGVWRRTGKLKDDIGWLLKRDIYGRKPTSSREPLHKGGKTVDRLDVDTLIQALGVADELVFRLRVMEALGLLTLAVHKNRGRMNWLTHTGAIKFPTEEGLENWATLDKGVADTEALLWEIVPPRAVVQQMHKWRKSGKLPQDVKTLLEKTDSHGRSPWMGSYEGESK